MRRLVPAGAWGVAALALLLHLACLGGYGYFRDELYFVACGHHLAWGYVDQPPLIAAVARLSEALSAGSLTLFRLPAGLAHATSVVIAAALATRLGSGRFGAILAAVCVAAAPVLLAGGQLLTMNAFEPLLWTGVAFLVLDVLDGGNPRAWIAAGGLVGLGILNKHSMALFASCLLLGVVAVPGGRRVLRRDARWVAAGAALAGLIVLPHAAWQVASGFPMLELLRNGQERKNAPFQLLALWKGQALEMNLLAVPVAIAGLGWLVTRKHRPGAQALGVACLATEALFTALHAKPYYLAPLYPVLLAAGGAALDGALSRWPRGRWIAPGTVAALGLVAVPAALPILPAETAERYLAALGVTPPRLERMEYRILPQHLADQFGWPGLVEAVARVHASLPPDERAGAVVFAPNYGEAAAIDLYGPRLGLPPASSGHNAYFLWGPHGDGRVVIRIGGDEEGHRRYFGQVELAGRTPPNPHGMPYEDGRPIFVLRQPRLPLSEIWPKVKLYI